jgi:hypothetical protein
VSTVGRDEAVSTGLSRSDCFSAVLSGVSVRVHCFELTLFVETHADRTRRALAWDRYFNPEIGSITPKGERVEFSLVFGDKEDDALMVHPLKIGRIAVGGED